MCGPQKYVIQCVAQVNTFTSGQFQGFSHQNNRIASGFPHA